MNLLPLLKRLKVIYFKVSLLNPLGLVLIQLVNIYKYYHINYSSLKKIHKSVYITIIFYKSKV